MSSKERAPGPDRSSRSGVIRFALARPRFFFCMFLVGAVTLLLPAHWRLITRGLVGWDVSVLAYFALIRRAIIHYGHEDIRKRAQALDSGRYTVLALTVITAIIALGAIMAELGPVKP